MRVRARSHRMRVPVRQIFIIVPHPHIFSSDCITPFVLPNNGARNKIPFDCRPCRRQQKTKLTIATLRLLSWSTRATLEHVLPDGWTQSNRSSTLMTTMNTATMIKTMIAITTFTTPQVFSRDLNTCLNTFSNTCYIPKVAPTPTLITSLATLKWSDWKQSLSCCNRNVDEDVQERQKNHLLEVAYRMGWCLNNWMGWLYHDKPMDQRTQP